MRQKLGKACAVHLKYRSSYDTRQQAAPHRRIPASTGNSPYRDARLIDPHQDQNSPTTQTLCQGLRTVPRRLYVLSKSQTLPLENPCQRILI